MLLAGAVEAPESAAQGRYLEIAARHGRAPVYHEALVLPDGDARQAVVTFRIPNSLLVFTQDRNGFEADVELTVTLYRGRDKVDEQIWRSRHRAATFEATQSRTDDLQGWVAFDVEPGDYAYRLVIHDDGGDDRGTARTFKVPGSRSALNGTLFFGDLARDSSGVSLRAANLAGDVPFGEDVPAIVPVTGEAELESDETVLTYRLYRVAPHRSDELRRPRAGRGAATGAPAAASQEAVEVAPGDILVSSGSVVGGDLVRLGALRRRASDCLCWANSAPSDPEGSSFAVLELGTAELESGTYILQVTPVRGGDSGTYVFATRWRDMPLSLYDVEVAIRNLEFIESRSTVREMLSGGRDAQVEAFKSYWSQRDPSPGTVRNELMEEYYRRVDEAAEKFRTGQHPVPDGLRTDPARIYIVNGEPERITNTLPSSGGIEQTWLYADGRTFVFWAGSSLAPLELVE